MIDGDFSCGSQLGRHFNLPKALHLLVTCFLSGFQLWKHLSSGTAVLKARRANQKMKGQAWRKVPSGISSPAPAFRSVGISQKSLPQILSHHPPVLPHPISRYLDTTWKLLEQYCLAVFKRKYSRLFFF